MLPFTEYVHPESGKKHRIPWDRDRARAKAAEFRQEAIDYFRARDFEKAQVVGVEVPEGSTVLPTCRFNANGAFTVDPIAASIKHAGSEVNDRWIPRWQEFCSVPQNDDGAEYKPVTYVPKSKRNVKPVELPTQSLDEIRDESGKVDMRTRAGRQRKRMMANV